MPDFQLGGFIMFFLKKGMRKLAEMVGKCLSPMTIWVTKGVRRPFFYYQAQDSWG